LYYLVNRPDVLALQIAKLHDRLGEPEAALASYEIALAEEEGNFDLHSRIVRALIAAGRGEDAVARAAKAVLRFRANREALALLREACKAVGREDKVADELNRLHRERPGDRAILFALADVLASEGREVESERILTAAALEGDGDVEAVRRLYRTYESRGETLKAARLLLEATATNADTTSEIANMIEGLIRTSRRGALRISALQQLEVSEKAQAAKWYWTARLASVWNRDALMMSSLEKATHAPGATFDPAYRLLLSLYWVKGDWDQKQKSDASQTLVEAATERNAGALAAELRGRILAYQGRHDQAAKMFEEAIEQGGDSPELHIAYADALLRQKLDGRAEQTLWKIVSDWPTFEAGYRSLFEYYVERQSISQAMKVLQTWLAADPDSVLARITQVRVFVQARRPDAAEQVLLETFRQNPDDGLLLQFMQAYYDQMGRLRDFAQMLKKEWADNPENREVVEQLTQVYVRLNRMADAMRVLDSTRAAVADDPDLLYYVASLYHRIGQKQSSEEVMLQVLEMQPDHAPANNDLGYAWADEGRNLKRAEAMIRIAVKAEPDNQSFLDSLGWVLYKRGRFAEAHKYLVEAIGPAALPDPIVLDHLGDVLYRLNRHDEAVKQWQRSLDRLGEVVANREDLRQLRSVLVRKLEQANAGQPVDVAPVIETPQQASN
jgi:tetratricopeptide (TPR) repeat protein